ncbi:MAG: biopolymer transporter ExbD [Verrucomicrobia bacterium]|nr:biopolymer transporter ExbD [Cytophagales bacterium]
MADVQNSDRGNTRRISTKVDMTPMVDLAFLLITFFMLATTFAKPKVMQVAVPAKGEVIRTMPIAEKNALTILLSGQNQVFYYFGLTNPDLEVSNFSEKGIRKVLMQALERNPKLFVLIKSDHQAHYKNMVDILDEMAITDMPAFTLADMTPEDEVILKNARP